MAPSCPTHLAVHQQRTRRDLAIRVIVEQKLVDFANETEQPGRLFAAVHIVAPLLHVELDDLAADLVFRTVCSVRLIAFAISCAVRSLGQRKPSQNVVAVLSRANQLHSHLAELCGGGSYEEVRSFPKKTITKIYSAAKSSIITDDSSALLGHPQKHSPV